MPETLNRFILGSHSIGVEYMSMQDGSYMLNVAVHVRVDSVAEVRYCKAVRSFDHLYSICKNYPISLCVSGSGIITKRLEENEDVARALPGLDDNQTIIRSYETDNTTWIALAKRNAVEAILNDFAIRGLKVVKLDLSGVSILEHIHLMAEFPDECGFHRFKWDEAKLVQYEVDFSEPKTLPDISVFGKPIEFLVAILVGFSFFGHKNILSVLRARPLLKNYGLFRIRWLAAITISAGVFIAAVANFFVGSSIEAKNEIMRSEVQSETLFWQSALKETALAEERTALFNQIAKTRIHFSQMLEDIAICVPTGIKLTSLELFPLKKTGSKTEIPEFDKNKIIIIGWTDKVANLNTLHTNLKNLAWVIEAQVVQFGSERGESQSKFIIHITV